MAKFGQNDVDKLVRRTREEPKPPPKKELSFRFSRVCVLIFFFATDALSFLRRRPSTSPRWTRTTRSRCLSWRRCVATSRRLVYSLPFFFSCLLTTAFELRAISVFSQQLEDLRKHEDPRLSFSTPEFREAQRIFTDNFKKNFGKPVEWAFVKKHAWSKPQLVKLDKPVRASRGDLPHSLGIPRG